jgi:hypothetical protein
MHRNALRLLATMLVVLGMLTLGVTRVAAQEELTVEVTFDPTIVPRTGQVTLSGTISCSEPAFVDIFGELHQQVGRIFTVTGFFGVRVQCPGPEGITYAVPVTPYQGSLTPGPARLTGSVFGCVFDPHVGCAKTFQRQLDTTIRIAPAP